MKCLALAFSLLLVLPAFAQDEENAPADGPTSAPAESKSISGGEPKEDAAPKAEAQPLITNPPKKLSRSRSNAKLKGKGLNKGKNSSGKVKGKSKKSHTKAKAKAKANTQGQWGIVQVDGAAAYKVPNFDSPVLDYLKVGSKMRMSQKVYPGIGGFGAFYKVKISGKTYGYIADVDVAPEFKAKVGGATAATDKIKNPVFESPEENEAEQVPIFFTRYIGASFGMVNYAEKFSSRKFASSEWLAGLRMSGPGYISEGIPTDISLLFHSGAPSYYSDKVGAVSPSGFFVLGDLFLPYPFLETQDMLITWGLGLMATYTKFNLQIKNSIFDSQELRAGLAAELGLSYRMGRFIVRVEGKYYYEKTDYMAYFLTLMGRY